MTAQREWYEKDYYAVLGVAQDAEPKEITKVYRKLARQSHPDARPGDAAAEERFKEISTAYDVLSDEKKRREYDEVRRLGPMGGGLGGNHFSAGGDSSSFNDLFQMFSGGRSRGGAGVGPRRGSDLETSLTLEFNDAIVGVTTSVYLTSDARCETCSGSGARPGTTAKSCGQCGGRGQVDDNQGVFSFASPCPRCGGRGNIVETPCGTCWGTGIEKRNREVKVRVPAGIADGQRIRLLGKGAPGRNGGPSGDLFVICHVGTSSLFGRDGDNLTVRVPITYPEAVLGADIDVPTLLGEKVTLRIKAGTQSGSRHRVKGRGIKTAKHQGDMIVTVEVVVPTSPSDDERSAIEALALIAASQPRENLHNSQ